jgi:hypothetical protein
MATLIVVSDLAEPASVGRGGLSMYLLQWLHGLERLGHRVLFVEFLKADPGETRGATVRYFDDTVARWWRRDASALILTSSGKSLSGVTAGEVARAAREAGAVVTVAAPYRRGPYPLIEDVRPRILVEQDPGYTHLWAAGGDPADIFGEHDVYFTVGGNVGRPGCSLPTLGIRWRSIWNPVVLDWWGPGRPVKRPRFTTVADWRGYGYLEFEGRLLGPKAEEFRKFIGLPGLIDGPVEIALNIDPEDPDLAALRDHGWKVENPEAVADPARYRAYIEGSLGEFSCAKGGYVGTNCGWFSDRSACYLAAGRPVVLQATGFEDLLPTGRGLFAVTTPGEAAETIRAVQRDYALHSARAREIAREHFDSAKVVAGLLSEAGIGGDWR